MAARSSWTYSIWLFTTGLLMFLIGLTIGLTWPGSPATDSGARSASVPEAIEGDAGSATSEDGERVAAAPLATAPDAASRRALPEDLWPARHLFVAVNGQWLAEGTKTLLRELRPGGVVLRDLNLNSVAQIQTLVHEIREATGLGTAPGDLPIIAADTVDLPAILAGRPIIPTAAELGELGDKALARELGKSIALAGRERGIDVVFGPVLDVYETATVAPELITQSFGADIMNVTSLGLAMVEGLEMGGVLPVVKHFPGYGAATYGSDGVQVVMNKDFSGLAQVMYPFNEAVRKRVPGMIVGHVAVPALDDEDPSRPAALSPKLVTELIRGRWGYEGVILADEIALNEMTRSRPAEKAVVEALAAGCDAIIFLDPNPARIRAACAAIEDAIRSGDLSYEQLLKSRERLQLWNETIAQRRPADEATVERVAQLVPVTSAPVTPPAAAPEPEPEPEPPAPIEEPVTATSEPDETSGDGAEVFVPLTEEAPDSDRAENDTPAIDSAEAEPPPEPTTEEASPPEPIPEVAPEASDEEEKTALETAVVAESTETATDTDDAPELESAEETAPPIETAHVDSGDAESESESPDIEDAETTTPEEPEIAEASAVAAPEPAESPEQDSGAIAESADASESTGSTEIETVVMAKAQVDTGEDETSGWSRIEHTLKEGETLPELAWAYGVTLEAIAEWNDLDTLDVQVGQVLVVFIPPDDHETPPETAPSLTDAIEEKLAELAEPEDPSPDFSSITTKILHAFAEGESMEGLAERYGVTAREIALWNGLNGFKPETGQVLTIFITESKAEDKDYSNIETFVYEVQPGDTVYKIARDHATRYDLILGINRIKNPDHIWVGQKLKIPIEQ